MVEVMLVQIMKQVKYSLLRKTHSVLSHQVTIYKRENQIEENPVY